MDLKETLFSILSQKYGSDIVTEKFITDNMLSVGGYLGRSKDPSVVSFRSELSIFLLQNFGKEPKLTESLYLIVYKYDEFPTCKREGCDKLVKFRNYVHGYSDYCSQRCVSLDTRELVKQKSLEKYGTEYAFQAEEVKEKIKRVNIERYGVDNPAKSKEIQRKIRATNQERYGVDYNLSNPEVRKKIRKTSLERYGTEVPSKSDIVKEKVRATNRERFGVDYPAQDKEITLKNTILQREKFFTRLLNSNRLKGLVRPNFKVDDYSGVCYGKYEFICNKCGNVFKSTLNYSTVPRCLKCFPYTIKSSSYEKELFVFCKDYSDNILLNNRSLLKTLELDLYFPNKNLAIEFNGLVWHSEIFGKKDKNYHLNKTLKCQEKGVQLIHIFEDEWINKQDIVKSLILHRLGKTPNKIYARQCEFRKVSNEETLRFLLNNHLQREIVGIYNYGLYYNDKLVSILVMGTPRFNKNYEYEIYRFCNKVNTGVIGGLSKLVQNFIRTHNNESIITYVDIRYGLGEGYASSGFTTIGQTQPGYYYIKDFTRENRIKYQKHKLQNILEIYDPTLTEWENMQLNNYDRIWDCGNKVYIYQ